MKKNNSLYAIKKLATFLAPHKLKLIGALITTILTMAAITVAPTVEGMITTQLSKDALEILKGIPGARVNFEYIARIIITLILLYFSKTTVQTIGIFLLTNSIQEAMFNLRSELKRKISNLPVKYFDKNSYGDLLSKITNDVETVSNALQQTLSQIISGIISLILAVTMMFIIQPVMGAIAVMIIPLSILITTTVIKKSQKHFNSQQNTLGELNGLITEKFTGYNEIIVYNQQQESVKEFEDINANLWGHAFKAQFMSSLMSPLISLVTYLVIGSTAVVGSLFAIKGIVAIGQIQAFIRYIWQVSDPVSQVSQLSSQIQSAFAAMDRIVEILDEPEEIPDNVPSASIEQVQGNVTFENVFFGYNDELVIQDFSINIKAGQMVAIVGPTGAGKTTIINLLLRFYDVNKGKILIDGVDIRDMKRNDLRSLFGMVLQDTWLFSGTIYDNIRYGKLDARKDEIIDAAKTANVHRLIKTLPHGYDLVMNEEGANISRGAKQLITLARAIIKNPKIMILDEATSSVDTRLEKRLQEAMNRVMTGRTSFIIAHRLSTIQNADLILVLKDGQIVEHGTHDDLITKKGHYEQLYYSQFCTE